MSNDPFKDFDSQFKRQQKIVAGGAIATFAFSILWILFLIGAISTLIYLAGKWIGAW